MVIEVVCSAFDVVVLGVGLVLAWRAPFRGVSRDVCAFIGLAGLSLIAVTLLTGPFGGFGVMRGWAHGLFCVVLPVMLVRAVRIRRHSPSLAIAGLLVFLVGEGCYVFAREIEPFRLEVDTVAVDGERLAALTQPLRIACVADLQTDAITDHEIGVFDRLVSLTPDLVLFLGDYLQLEREAFLQVRPALVAQVNRLNPPLGMFAVEGDVDGGVGGAAAVFAGTSVQVLNDAYAALPGVPIDVHGLSRMRSRAPFVDAGLLRRLAGERFPIVIGHAPDFMLSVVRDGLDVDALMVAGHTHGGQVQLPWLGPLLTLSAVPRWLAGGGVFRRGRTWLCCSRGIGMERGHAPRLRFWCRPQLVVLELGRRPAAAR